MNPIIYLHKDELGWFTRVLAMLFLVIGTAIVTAALIVQIGAANFQFGSVVIGMSLLPFVILAGWLVVAPHLSAWRRSCFSFLNAVEPIAWHDQLANAEERVPLILIAAADVFMRAALQFHFTRAGFRVEHAATCDQALAKLKIRPDAILLDLGMPSDKRFYCLRDCRKASPSSKIIALTRTGDPRDTVICRKIGAFDSIPKPFDPTDAVSKVTHALHREIVEAIPLHLSA